MTIEIAGVATPLGISNATLDTVGSIVLLVLVVVAIGLYIAKNNGNQGPPDQ